MEEILLKIKDEQKRAEELWGIEFDDKNTINDWATFINRYVSKAADDVSFDPLRIETNLIKAGALIVSALKALERNGDKFAQRHYDY